MAERLPPPHQLDRAQLETLCLQRFLQDRQRRRNEIQSKRDEIERAAHLSLEEEEGIRLKPYGMPMPWEWEGDAPVVWCRVLGHVTDPCEIKNLWQVSDIFRDILRPKYIQTLLPEIVKLIKDKYPKYLLRENFQDGYANFDGRSVDHFEALERTRVLADLRLISKQCKVSAELDTNACLDIWRIAHLRKICGHVRAENFNKSEFYPRQLDVDEDYIWDNFMDMGDEGEIILAAFHEGIKTFLALVGQRIRIFHYCTYQRTAEEIYGKMLEWTALMPNLEKLEVFIGRGDMEANPISLEEVQAFPTCRSLTFYSEPCHVLPAAYTQRILEASPELKDLRLAEVEPVREHSVQVLASHGKLTELHICPYPSLLGRLNFNWKLNKLVLYRDDRTYQWQGTFTTTITSSQLFPFLRQFEETLEHLEVTVDLVNNGGYMELRNLKTFKWKYHSSFKNIRFLLPAEKLETIVVVVWESFRPNNEKYQRINRDVCESFLGIDIWKVLLCLMIAEVRNVKYDRHGVPRTRLFWKGTRKD